MLLAHPGRPGEKAYTTAQLAAAFGVTERTLIYWRKKGIGPPYYQATKSVLYFEEDVKKWLEGSKSVG
jgi:DNA-binding transcriptional MerR regulator